jgi:S-formylglutathione hydrolase FrmB
MAPEILVAFDADGPRGAKDLTNFCNRATDGYRAEDMIVDELVPWVDTKFRTVAKPESRALWGYSAGGFGALNLGLRHPGVWKNIASHAGFYMPESDAQTMSGILGSPTANAALWQSNSPLRNARALRAGVGGAGLHVYLDASPNEEDYDGFLKIGAALRASGADVQSREYQKAHAWRVITQHCRESLLFIARAFATPVGS